MPGVGRALQVFFSYADESRHFVRGFLKETRFQEILRCKIWDYGEKRDQVIDPKAVLSRRIRDCDVFVAFISTAYRDGAQTIIEIEEAIRLVAEKQPAGRIRHVIVFFVDADGYAWWDARRAAAANGLTDFFSAMLVDERGGIPQEVEPLVGKIDEIATQIRDLIDAEPKSEKGPDPGDRRGQHGPAAGSAIAEDSAEIVKAADPARVVILGHPAGKAAPQVAAAREALAGALAARGVNPYRIDDGWSAADAGAHAHILEAVKAPARPVLIQPVDAQTANNYVLAPDLLTKEIANAAGLGDDANTQADIEQCQRVFWLPAGLVHKGFEKKAAENLQKERSGVPNPVLRTGSPPELGNWIAHLIGIPASTSRPPPAMGYESIQFEYLQRMGENIITRQIIPGASAPLRNRYDPPELEPLPFQTRAQAEQRLVGLSRYDCGIFAIHNIGGQIDEDGELPEDFVQRVFDFDALLEERRSQGIRLDRIIRLGIVATMKPERHQFKYGRQEVDYRLSKWCFVAVEVAGENQYRVIDAHLNLLRGEIFDLINPQPAAAQ